MPCCQTTKRVIGCVIRGIHLVIVRRQFDSPTVPPALQLLPDRCNRSSIKLHVSCGHQGHSMPCVRTVSEPESVPGQISTSIKYSCGFAVWRSSCTSQEFLPHVDGRTTYVKIPVGRMITPMRTSTLHPVPNLELPNAAFVAAQGLLVSKGTPNQRAGLIPLTCCVCHTIFCHIVLPKSWVPDYEK